MRVTKYLLSILVENQNRGEAFKEVKLMSHKDDNLSSLY